MKMKLQKKITEVNFCDGGEMVMVEFELTPEECWKIYQQQKEENYKEYIKEYIEEDCDLLDDLSEKHVELEEFEGDVLIEFIRNKDKYDMADETAVTTAIDDCFYKFCQS